MNERQSPDIELAEQAVPAAPSDRLGAQKARVRQMTVFTHRRPSDTSAALQELITRAAAAGVTIRLDPEETSKHRIAPGPGVLTDAPVTDDVELCIVLGGDGTILRALQRYAGSDVPVFAVNFGEIGFLATVEPLELRDGLDRAFRGDFELLRLPAIVLQTPEPERERRTAARRSDARLGSTMWRSTARSASASPRSRTRSRVRSSAAYAATGS